MAWWGKMEGSLDVPIIFVLFLLFLTLVSIGSKIYQKGSIWLDL